MDLMHYNKRMQSDQLTAAPLAGGLCRALGSNRVSIEN